MNKWKPLSSVRFAFALKGTLPSINLVDVLGSRAGA